MPQAEPQATAILLTALGLMMGLSALISRPTGRMGVPLVLVFLVVGMVAGSDGIGGIEFEDYGYSFRVGTAALVLILFDGGLNTPVVAVRQVLAPASVLATVGVLGTAGLMAVAAHALGFSWPEAMVLGAVVSSTDAAAVFSVLRNSGLQLRRRVGNTLELESGLNDPMAVILTITLTHNLQTAVALDWHLVMEVLWQLLAGGGCGVLVGVGGRGLLTRVRLAALGLYPVMTVALGLVSFGLASLLHASGFLAVYVAGIVLGDSKLPNRAGLLRVHDALAWLAQVTMFLLLGLLVFPTRVFSVADVGLALALVLALVARPVAVVLCLLPFRYPWRDMAFVSWVGLRGAVPIVLATYPVLVDAPGARKIFDVVFFVVVVNALLPGATVRWATRILKQASPDPPPPPAFLDIVSTRPLSGEVLAFHIDEASAVTGVQLSDVPFPEGASVMLVVRGEDLIPPRGTTTLHPGDHVYVLCAEQDRPLVLLMFGRRLED